MSIDLLKAAADAIGLQYEWHHGCGEALHLTAPNAQQIYWNPLRDNSDAFRLAVALHLHVARTSPHLVVCWAEKAPFDSDAPGCDRHRGVAHCWFGEDALKYPEHYGPHVCEDQLAASRMAIVLGAVAVGTASAGAAIWAATPSWQPRPGLLALAEKCGAVLTGKPDGSEAIAVVFTADAWRAFDAAMAPNV